MRAGELNTLVAVEHVTRAEDQVLGTPAGWETLAKAWCKVEVAGGGESAAEQQQTQTNTWTLTTHWTEELAAATPRMRVRLPGGRLLGIKSIVNPHNRNRELVLTCEESS